MSVNDVSYCGNCHKSAAELYETDAKIEGVSTEEYARQDGTYNRETHEFWCMSCYITLGMPLGVCR